jgi:hypothetical protein
MPGFSLSYFLTSSSHGSLWERILKLRSKILRGRASARRDFSLPVGIQGLAVAFVAPGFSPASCRCFCCTLSSWIALLANPLRPACPQTGSAVVVAFKVAQVFRPEAFEAPLDHRTNLVT